MLGENMMILQDMTIKDKKNEDLNSECCEQGLNNLNIKLIPVANQL